jgi:ABC-type lipoprotein release transport system permease subunit
MALLGLWLGTVAVAVVAGLIPARRAGRVTPIAALSDLG